MNTPARSGAEPDITLIMERSQRHGLSDVAIRIAALPGNQRSSEIVQLDDFIREANKLRQAQGLDPNASVDLEDSYMRLHPIPKAA